MVSVVRHWFTVEQVHEHESLCLKGVSHCAKVIELLQRNLFEGADQVGSGTATDTNASPLDQPHTACAHGANRTHLIMMKSNIYDNVM